MPGRHLRTPASHSISTRGRRSLVFRRPPLPSIGESLPRPRSHLFRLNALFSNISCCLFVCLKCTWSVKFDGTLTDFVWISSGGEISWFFERSKSNPFCENAALNACRFTIHLKKAHFLQTLGECADGRLIIRSRAINGKTLYKTVQYR